MARYDEGRDDERRSYGGGARRRGNGGERFEDDDYERGPARSNRDLAYDETLRGGRAASGRDYGRDYNRDYGRSYGRNDYGEYGGGRYGERSGYGSSESRYGSGYGGPRGYEREDEGRSMWDETRDYTGARRDERRGASRSHVRCRDIMTRDVTVATGDTTLEEIARLMKEEDTGVIPVVERGTASEIKGDIADETRRASNRSHNNGKLVGLITDRDIVIRALAEGKDGRTTRAEEIMTDDVYTAQPNDRVIEAIRKMGDKQVRRIPIVDGDNNLLGIISMADVALETEADQELADALEEISSGRSFWSRIFG
ncbi:MAG TPA: CBS domain-containing protein [Pyrinomonadaceae bacterium]